MKRIAGVALVLSLAAVLLPARASTSGCAALRARTWRAATGHADAEAPIRVYAMQYAQQISDVENYASFRARMFCMVDELVMPTADADRDGVPDKPTIVVFNEDGGLATIATGSRGAPARAFAAVGPKDPQNIPGALGAFATLAATYEPAVAWYAARAPETGPQRLILAAATDVFARGFMQTFSDMARAYGIWVVSSNNQAEFRETGDPAAVAALADPDLAGAYASGALRTVYEAVDRPGEQGDGRAGIDVQNQAWMWAPTDAVTDYARARFEPFNGGPLSATDPRRNIVQNNRKTPLTPIERQILDLSDDGDVSVANTGPFCFDEACRIRIGYGISLPSFKWGTPFGVPFDGDPCATSQTWMRCLDARGVNLFLQPEANPGMWAEYIDVSWKPAAWQALSWLDSAWRAVADPTVHNIRYAVTPHLVGNLVDLTFDGQSAIFERCLATAAGDTCDGNLAQTFVGARDHHVCGSAVARCDDPALQPYTGLHRELVVAAPWVLPDCPECLGPLADRERLAARARAMQAGSGSAHENDYLETAVFADLRFD